MSNTMSSDTPNNILDLGGSLKNHQKTPFFAYFWGHGKIDAKVHFGHNPLISSIEYGCENHFLSLKSHPKPFKYVPFNGF